MGKKCTWSSPSASSFIHNLTHLFSLLLFISSAEMMAPLFTAGFLLFLIFLFPSHLDILTVSMLIGKFINFLPRWVRGALIYRSCVCVGRLRVWENRKRNKKKGKETRKKRANPYYYEKDAERMRETSADETATHYRRLFFTLPSASNGAFYPLSSLLCPSSSFFFK